MPVTPSGPLSIAIATLRSMIAACPSFQQWTDSADAAEAEEHVYALGLLTYTPGVTYEKAEIVDRRPFVIINLSPRGEGFAFHEAGLGGAAESGSLWMHFEADIPDGTTDATYQDVAFEFLNKLGNTLDELMQQGDEGGKLIIQKIHTVKPIERVEPKLIESMGDFHHAGAVVDYGIK